MSFIRNFLRPLAEKIARTVSQQRSGAEELQTTAAHPAADLLERKFPIEHKLFLEVLREARERRSKSVEEFVSSLKRTHGRTGSI